MKKNFKDRRDAKRLEMNGFEKLVYHFKPKRSESEVFILKSLDVTELVKYMDKLKETNKDITYFHLFSTAISKVLYNRPSLNIFYIGGKKYMRNDVNISFVAKTNFNDDAKEFLSVIDIDKNDDLYKVSSKIKESVKSVRSNKESSTDNFIYKLSKCPNFIVGFMVWVARKLDNHDLLPKFLMEGDVYHSSVLISNLGSVHCDGIYHNLTNYGTNSILCTIGEIKETVKVINGKEQIRKVCDFGITLDERIADGVYMIKSINMMQHIFNNPKTLEDKVNKKIDASL